MSARQNADPILPKGLSVKEEAEWWDAHPDYWDRVGTPVELIEPADDSQVHSLKSAYREAILEHLFAGEIMRFIWQSGVYQLEMLKPQVDDAGYDLVLETNTVVRHIQMKSSFVGSHAQPVVLNKALALKPSGCVVLVRVHPRTLAMGPFFFFGAGPGERLPALSSFVSARRTTRNRQGERPTRPNSVTIPRSRFERVETIAALTTKLFGALPHRPEQPA